MQKITYNLQQKQLFVQTIPSSPQANLIKNDADIWY